MDNDVDINEMKNTVHYLFCFSPVAAGLIILYKTDDNILNTELKKLDDTSINIDEKNISHIPIRVAHIGFHYRGFASKVTLGSSIKNYLV